MWGLDAGAVVVVAVFVWGRGREVAGAVAVEVLVASAILLAVVFAIVIALEGLSRTVCPNGFGFCIPGIDARRGRGAVACIDGSGASRRGGGFSCTSILEGGVSWVDVWMMDDEE